MTFSRRRTLREKKKKSVASTVTVTSAALLTQVVPVVLPNSVSAATTSQAQFIQKIGEQARIVAAENDLYASVMIAQAILESDWGRSGLTVRANNLFGVKGHYQQNSLVLRTAEQTATGEVYYINEPFRKYPSYRESMLDYVAILKGSQYYSGAWKSNTASYRQATQHLTGRYATAINYNIVLNNIIATYGLTQYDTPATSRATVSTNQSVQTTRNTTAQTAVNAEVKEYVVQPGDSVWAISLKFNLTMTRLIQLNNIKNNFIYPGQRLVVSGDATKSVESVKPNVVVSKSQPNKVTTTTVETNSETYVVQSGDSVWAISNKFGITMDKLRALNNIQNNFIYPGQKLVVKGNSNGQVAKPVANKANTVDTTSKTYEVQAGDSVWRIANKFGITMDSLRTLNNIQNNFIYPGQILNIR